MQLRTISNHPVRTVTIEDRAVDGTERLSDSILRRFDGFWRSRAWGESLPSSDDFDLTEIADLLPHVMVVDVVRDDDRMRFATRLVGQHHADLFGRATAWNALMNNEGALDGAVHMVDVVEQARPRYSRGRAEGTPRGAASFERVTYPLASNGFEVDRLISVLVPHYRRTSRMASLFAWF